MRLLLCLILASFTAILPGLANATDRMTIILAREADAISLYFTTSADRLPEIFGRDAGDLEGADGTIDIDGLYDGTFLIADDVLSGVDVAVEGQPVVVEAMSMMVHDPEVLPEFDNPISASQSIAVCTSPETVRNMSLNQLEAYMGFFAWKLDGFADLTLRFPETGRGALEITLLDFADYRLVEKRTISVEDGGQLAIAAVPEDVFQPVVSAGVAISAVASGLLALIGFYLLFPIVRTHFLARLTRN